jgi:hypothetical protein
MTSPPIEWKRHGQSYAWTTSWVGGRSTIGDISIPYLRNTKAASVGRLWENATDAILGRRQKQAVPKSRKAMTADKCHGAEASQRARPAQVPCAPIAAGTDRLAGAYNNLPILLAPFSLQ